MGTREFGQAIIQRLGQKPTTLKEAVYMPSPAHSHKPEADKHQLPGQRELLGVDIYVYFTGKFDELKGKLEKIKSGPLQLSMIGNRGSKLWPDGVSDATCVDVWRCRFTAEKGGATQQHIVALLSEAVEKGFDITHTENLYQFGSKTAFEDRTYRT